MAEGFLALGADVAICGRRLSVLEDTAAQWRTEFPGRRVDTFGVDIRIAQSVDEMVEGLWASGGLTGLVNNAAGNFVAPRACRRAPSTPWRASCSMAAST
jgi:NAD(P)-dependent dehydrogenase (short-subunit alcohol dehydrogenase family)